MDIGRKAKELPECVYSHSSAIPDAMNDDTLF